MASGFPGIPQDPPAEGNRLREWLRRLSVVLQSALQGKLNCVGSVTLTVNQATTTLADARIGPESAILFMPTTLNAAAGLTALYVSARGKETATLTHANNAQADRSYDYAVIG